MNVLNALKYKIDRNTLEKLYFAFVRSKLEYANIVWDNASSQLSDLLESVQYRAAKIVSGAIHRTSHNMVYSDLAWETLEDRRKKQRLKVFYKIAHSDAPIYLQNTLPVAEQNRYNLRHEKNYPTIGARTSAFQNTYFPKTISEWNSLDEDVKHSDSTESFSRKLKKENKTSPKWYCAGDRRFNIVHAKLRMLCSPLNDHLYSFIHVVDTPSCTCGHPRENNKHFLLECPLYMNERNVMIQNLEEINFHPSLNNLLYGNGKYIEEKNTKAFIIIQEFFRDSGRF